MPLRIKCPTGHSLIVSEDRAGRTLRCPRCDQPVVVPHVPKPPAQPEAGSKPLMAKVAEPLIPTAPPAALSKPESSTEPALPAKRTPQEERPAVALRTVVEPTKIEPPVTVLTAEGALPVAAPPAIIEPPPAAPPIEPPPVVGSIEPPQTAPPPIEPPPIAAMAMPPIELPPVEEEIVPPPVEPPPPAPLPIAAGEVVRTNAEPVLEAATEPRPAATEEERESAAFAEVAAPDEPLPPPKQREMPRSRPAPALPGVIHDRSNVLVVYQLAAAVVAAALFGMAPAVWDIAEYWRFPEMHFVARWAFVLLFLGMLQLAYAVYIVHLPDWGTVWVVTLYCLGLATLYAMMLGLTLISREDAAIVRFLQLEDKIAGSKAALWCICMVSVATLLAFFAGQISVRWHKTEQLLRRTDY